MDSRETAKRLLVHYFKLIAKKSGVRWDSDNATEIGDIVDLIIDAARDADK